MMTMLRVEAASRGNSKIAGTNPGSEAEGMSSALKTVETNPAAEINKTNPTAKMAEGPRQAKTCKTNPTAKMAAEDRPCRGVGASGLASPAGGTPVPPASRAQKAPNEPGGILDKTGSLS
jgi:hypothetical protein